MPATTVTGSVNISLLDSKIVADLCAGTITIDASPSIFTGGGASNVLGVKVQVKSPSGIIIKDYGASYDAAPALSGGVIAPVVVTIPTKGGNYQYGVYTFSVLLTDANGVQYTVTKTQNICAYPDEATICQNAVEMIANCQAGRLDVLMAAPFTYQGQMAASTTQSWTLYYPTNSGLVSMMSSVNNFAVHLFEGVYRLVGSMCVTYAMGDNIFIAIGFSGDWSKNVKCVIDYTCLFPQLAKLGKQLKQACSDSEKASTTDIIVDTLWLLTKINITLDAGEDASDDIAELEKLLGGPCTNSCNSSAPIINNAPSTSINITGCNVQKTTVGLTDVYEIENYEFLVDTDPNQDLITVSAPSLNNCTKKQRITLNTAKIYEGFQNQVNTTAQYAYWAAVINNYLIAVDPACLDLTTNEWNNLSLAGKIQAIIAMACTGGNCMATATAVSSNVAADVTLALTMAGGAYSADIFVDNVLKGTVLAAATSYKLVGMADGILHNYLVIPKCSNGNMGVPVPGTFQYLACPTILAPSVSSNNVNGAACPYDLTALVAALPAGITAEWHTSNDTLSSSILGNPAAAGSGVYFVFAKDTRGCYSIGVQVQLICSTGATCTAPQNLTVGLISGGFLVQFQSAAVPPPANSYTVKRRLASDPDVSGSYTVIGTPTFNSGSNRWEILDTTVSTGVNAVYVYEAISNCAGGPLNIQTTFVNINCPAGYGFVTTQNHIDFSFSRGTGITSYRVNLLNSTGESVVQTQTIVPGGGGTVNGTFFYLNPSTTYQIVVIPYIGTYNNPDCVPHVLTTSVGTNAHVANNVPSLVVTSIKVAGTDIIVPSSGAFPLNNGQSLDGLFSTFGGAIQVATTGISASSACLYLDGVLQQSVDTSFPGTHTFANAFYSSGQQLVILFTVGSVCP